MKKVILSVIIFILFLSYTFSDVYFVSINTGQDLPTNGSQENPFQTITYALSQVTGTLANPHSLFVAQGTYVENVLVGDYMKLYGGFDEISWHRKPDQYKSIIENPFSSPYTYVVSLGNNVIIDGFTIQGGFNGINTTSSNVIIFNNKIKNNTQYGIKCKNASGSILYNDLQSNSLGDIRDETSTLYIKGNNIYNSGWGIIIINSSPTIEFNDISCNIGTGVYISGESAPTIKNNLMRNNFNGVTCSSTTSITSIPSISENIISRSTKEGIIIKYFNPEIINNVLTLNEDAIRLEYSNATIINNSISNNSKNAVYCYISSSPTVINNILTDNGVCGIYERTLDSDPTVTYNCFSGNDVGDYYDERWDDIYGTIYNGANDINTKVNNGSNICDFNIDGPPLYIGLISENLHLTESSPCVSQADPTNSPPIDKDGVTRPYGTGYDIGAYEYVPQGAVQDMVWSVY